MYLVSRTGDSSAQDGASSALASSGVLLDLGFLGVLARLRCSAPELSTLISMWYFLRRAENFGGMVDKLMPSCLATFSASTLVGSVKGLPSTGALQILYLYWTHGVLNCSDEDRHVGFLDLYLGHGCTFDWGFSWMRLGGRSGDGASWKTRHCFFLDGRARDFLCFLYV